MSEYFRMMGDLDRAVASGQRARALATRLGDVGLQVQANYFVGAVYYDLGDYLSAIDCLGWNVAALEGHLSRELFGMAALPSVLSRSYLSWSLAEVGAFAEGTARGEEGVRIAEAAEHPFSLIWAYAGIGKLALDKGDVHRGIPVLERGLGLCQRWHISTLFPTVALGLGRAYALSGRVTEALLLLEQAATQARKGMGYGPRLLSEAYLLAGRLGKRSSVRSIPSTSAGMPSNVDTKRMPSGCSARSRRSASPRTSTRPRPITTRPWRWLTSSACARSRRTATTASARCMPPPASWSRPALSYPRPSRCTRRWP